MNSWYSYYKQATFFLAISCVFAGDVDARDQPGLNDRQIISAAVEFYRKSKTLNDLVKSNPDFGPSAKRIYSQLLFSQIEKPLQAIAFDFAQKTLRIGQAQVELTDLAKGKVKFNGTSYTFDRNLNHYQNLENILQLITQKKNASLGNFFVTAAFAQNRDDFPTEASENYRGKDIPKIAASYAVDSYLLYTGLRSIIKRVGIPLASNYITLALVASWVVNKAHAYAAPSCETQINKLKSIMNEYRISLSQLECGTTSSSGSESIANISFWTPDKKVLPFFTNWETSEAFVNNAVEVYYFDWQKLSKVEVTIPLKNKDIISESGLANYKKILEPYRKVFYEIGINNSCHKCADEFKTKLVQKSPMIYKVDANAEATPNLPNVRPTTIKK